MSTISTEIAILGGGLAGLAAARRLLELGQKPLIIESGNYPAHKVCGEFFSPTSVNLLQRWDVNLIPVHKIRLHTHLRQLAFDLPKSAGALSHVTLDPELARQVVDLGATLLTHTKVEAFIPGETMHQMTLSSGVKVLAKHVLIAAGRLASSSGIPPAMRYMGFKTHLTGIDLQASLEMFSFPGAYLGLAPIEDGKANLACLITLENYRKAGVSPACFMQRVIESHPVLRPLVASGTNLFGDWMQTTIPEFGLKVTPAWPRTYWIGDAAGTIPPASGSGLSLALASGCLAAEYVVRDDPVGFKHTWRKQCAARIRYAKLLHQVMLHPAIGNSAITVSRVLPSLGDFMMDRIGMI